MLETFGMANSNSPFGFRQTGRLPGADPSFELVWRKLAASYATTIGRGDVIEELVTGYVGKMTGAAGTVYGIADGFQYYSSAVGRRIWSPTYPASGSASEIDIAVIVDPYAIFEVQAGATGIAFSDIGGNVIWTDGTVNTITGQSGSYLDDSSVATTDTLGFRILGLAPAADSMSPSTGAYNIANVTFNNQAFKNRTGKDT